MNSVSTSAVTPARRLCSDAAAGLIALGSDRAHHAMRKSPMSRSLNPTHTICINASSNLRTCLNVNPRLASPSYQSAKLCLAPTTATGRTGMKASLKCLKNDLKLFTIWSNVLGQSAIRAGQRGKATRALPILDLAINIFQRLDQHDKRKVLRDAFRPLERLEQTEI